MARWQLCLNLLTITCCAAGALGAYSGHAAAYVTSGGPAAAAHTSAANDSPGFVVHMTLNDEQLPEYGPSFKRLDVEVTPETVERLHVKIRPSDTPRWEVPESIIPRPGPQLSRENSQRARLLYALHQPFDSPGNPFALKVMRTSTEEPIFDSTGHRFLFKDQFIELSTNVPEDADLYGLGEVTLPTGLLLPRDNRIITLYNRDLPAAVPYANLYGSHPFLLQVNKDGTSHGVFFLNSNGMDVLLNKTSVTYRVIGGLVDLYFFLGPSPEAVIRQYHQVVGAPAMPPYWALGVHQGRWGYTDINALEEVVANYSKAGIPLDSLWLDIEYMGNRFKTLTFDEHRFPVAKMRAFVDKLHASGQHWVPIHDAAISKQSGYKAYDEGSKAGVWIQEANGQQPYVGQVWPGEAVYPDYLSSPNVTTWLQNQLQYFYDQVPFDGLWLDMNEASNFCSGSNCRAPTDDKAKMFWLEAPTPKDYNLSGLIKPRTSCLMTCDEDQADSRLANPPYKIHNFFWDAEGNEITEVPLNSKVISPTAVHADGTREYDAHNLFGTSMAMRSRAAAEGVMGKRPFMLLRSTFPGAGRFTGHWTGDNGANFQSFADSVASILASNMWGIPMVGADICGFVDMDPYNGNGKDMDPPKYRLDDSAYQQLCNRWTSAGAFYPFVRNHYTFDSRQHEPYRWPDVASAARKAYGMRYQLLTYLYSSMHLAHSHGGTLARPLFFTDPADREARSANHQWMMGEALLVNPVLEEGEDTVTAHFTTGTWYSVWDYTRVEVAAVGSKVRKLRVPLGDVPLHLRGGAIVPMQRRPALVARDVRLSPVTLVVALPSSASTQVVGPVPAYALEESCNAARAQNPGRRVACGNLFMDSGEDIAVTTDNSVQVWFTAAASADGSSGSISSTVTSNAGEAKGKILIEAIHVLGVPPSADDSSFTVAANGKTVTAVTSAAGVLRVGGLRLAVGEPLDISWQSGAAPTV